MAMKRCPVCGEKYSDTYKECPFCEEGRELQELQKGGGRARKSARGGRRTAARSRKTERSRSWPPSRKEQPDAFWHG